jgi:serine phosphatase RsbU (regulator of sigma subunit)/ketosteroid isomerase-like protein
LIVPTRDQVTLLLRRHQEALNRHDVAALTPMYADSAVVTSPMFQTVRGRSAIEGAFTALFQLWPDYQVRVNEDLLIYEENRVAEFGSVMATHSTTLFGLPPTGDRIEYEFVRLYTFDDSEIVEERRIYDLRGILDRLSRSQLDRELKVAGAIQRLLLPRTHHRGSHFEVMGASRPSRTIGGDFFEYVDLPSGNFGVAIGDVSGKGPGAALVGALVQGMFSVEAESERAPASTLARLNQALRRRDMEPRFVTLMYGMLSPDGRFRYSNSGQNPPILLTSNGVQRLTVGGPMLGPFENPVFAEDTISVYAGDTIVLFSDGVTDAANEAGDDFGEARLLDCVVPHRHEPVRTILENIFASVRAFCGEVPPNDDQTVVVVRVN